MLIEFTVGNYLSFKKPVTFSMVAANSVKEYESANAFTDPANKFKLLKVAALYGANGSGKSNLISSVLFMKKFILNSFRDALSEQDESLTTDKFLLNTESEYEPSLFEIVFICQNKRYRYGFEVDEDKIISEWLFFVNTAKEIQLFTRDGRDIECNSRSFKEGRGLEKKTRENVLFLSVVAQFDGEKANNILQWFKNLKTISGLDDITCKNYTIKKIHKDKEFKRWTESFVKFLEIEDLSADKETDAGYLPDEDLRDFISAPNVFQKKRGELTDKIVTWHNRFDDDKVVGRIPFDFDRQESEGTKKLIGLSGPLYDVLQNGLVLIADELDSRFHPLLTMKIVEFFHKNNPKNAQLIFASHDTNLLKKDMFRRDQIWFAEKNKYGESDLYSLVEYREYNRVRDDASFDKNYLAGKYGAIPFFGDMNNVPDLIYGEEKEG
ncbi:MAG: ATP-binding protein [Desulfobacterales bacterium]|nr:ATP-binding protein [Desulfobacterales bacterium]